MLFVIFSLGDRNFFAIFCLEFFFFFLGQTIYAVVSFSNVIFYNFVSQTFSGLDSVLIAVISWIQKPYQHLSHLAF